MQSLLVRDRANFHLYVEKQNAEGPQARGLSLGDPATVSQLQTLPHAGLPAQGKKGE